MMAEGKSHAWEGYSALQEADKESLAIQTGISGSGRVCENGTIPL